MGIAVDLIIVAVAFITVMLAYRAGLVKSVMGLVRGIASFIAAYAFTPTLSKIIYDRFMLKSISSGLRAPLRSLSENGDGSYNLAEMYNTMIRESDGTLADIVENYKVDVTALERQCEGITDATEKTVDKVCDFIASPIANSISSAISYILIFVGVFVALTILTRIVDLVFRLPVLYDVNKIFGVIFGLVEATVLVLIISNAGAALLIALGSVDGELFGAHVVESTVIMKNVMRIFPSVNLFGLIESLV